MTVIIDPLGTPEPVYTRSGTTIQTIMANGITQGDATAITAVSGVTVVLALVSVEGTDPVVTHRAVKLPDDAQIGDVVEVHFGLAEGSESASGLLVFPASGDSIDIIATDASVPVPQYLSRAVFRKMTATLWSS